MNAAHVHTDDKRQSNHNRVTNDHKMINKKKFVIYIICIISLILLLLVFVRLEKESNEHFLHSTINSITQIVQYSAPLHWPAWLYDRLCLEATDAWRITEW